VELQLLLSAWRTTKIHWHGEKWNYYGDEDEWRQYQFEPGGRLSVSYNFKGKHTPSFYAYTWVVEKDNIILYEFAKRHGNVKSIIEDSLIIQLSSGITLYFRETRNQ
jgi:hypothetical protein